MSAVLYFHGSPGHPSEIQWVEAELKALHWAHSILAKDRFNKNEQSLNSNANCCIGYSWGAALALRHALEQPAIQSVLLISPYLFPKPLGFVKKTILNVPGLGNRILGKSAPKAIDDFFKKACSPAEVPHLVWETRQHYLSPMRLKNSLFEKELPAMPMNEVLEKLTARNLKLYLIWGRKDLTSLESEQITPLRKYLKPPEERIIEQGGHALIWTHAKEISQWIVEFIKP